MNASALDETILILMDNPQDCGLQPICQDFCDQFDRGVI
jgi:hypothetical protein